MTPLPISTITKVFHPRIVPIPNATITELRITELFNYGLLLPNVAHSWNPAPVVKFISDKTDYNDPSTDGSSKLSSNSPAQTMTKPTKKSATAARPPSILTHLESKTSSNDKTETLTMRMVKGKIKCRNQR